MKSYETIIIKFGNIFGWILIIAYTLIWISAAFGVAHIIYLLLKTSLFEWIKFEGWKKYYLALGAITVLIVVLKAIPFLFKEGISLLIEDPVGLLVAIVVFACIPILIIPLMTVGWPAILYWEIQSYLERKKNRVPSNT